MRGFLRLALDDQESGAGVIQLGRDELVGCIVCSPTTTGVGTIVLSEDDEDGRVITRIDSNQYTGGIIYGPFEHISKRIYWEMPGMVIEEKQTASFKRI